MMELKFKCTLLSDVILNKKSATTGPNETLDFIPGSNFLGIAAGILYPRLEPTDALMAFHSGKVRFGDAHPSVGDFRGLKVPASMFYPKLKKPEEELFIHHLIRPDDEEIRKMQLKQCREGFYDFAAVAAGGKRQAPKIKTATDFAIKSAYDPMARRSRDEQLFGYQALQQGLTMYFSVEIDDEAAHLKQQIATALTGTRRIGRSRTAQYGLVEIEPFEYAEIPGGSASGNLATVYADGRLIFLDEYGQPTFQPTAEQLGISGGEIDWEKSQIRTFRYAPWNFKRQCFDTDRCGIEKGSVIAVRLSAGSHIPSESGYVGAYRCEGFGKVIYNPAFLAGDKTTGKALFTLQNDPKSDIEQKKKTGDSPEKTSMLVSFLRDMKKGADDNRIIYELVDKWVGKHSSLFSIDKFASQWSTIREFATTAHNMEALKKELFDPTEGYLKHGVAKEKWAGKRLVSFKEFVETTLRDSGLNDAKQRTAIVNLASEMGKKCK